MAVPMHEFTSSMMLKAQGRCDVVVVATTTLGAGAHLRRTLASIQACVRARSRGYEFLLAPLKATGHTQSAAWP
jgi:hypothetical protein